MPIRAENDPRFSRRFLYMGIAAFGFALWCLYDGAIAYPNQRERALALNEILENNRSLPLPARLDKWNALARERGWPTSDPGEPKSEADVIMQYVMAGMAATVGLWLVSIPLRARGRWIELSDSELDSSWGQSLQLDQILALNKRQWRSKGIAKITYQDGRRKRRFVLDNYKFDRHATDSILYEIEQRIDPALITGGPPEPPPGEHDVAHVAADPALDGRGDQPA